MTLTNKLLLLVVSVIFLMLAGSYYFINQKIRVHLENSQLEWVGTLTGILSESVAKDTINGNKINVHELLQRIVKDKAIEFAYVTDMNGELFAHSFEDGFPRFLLERIASHSHTVEAPHFNKQLFTTKQGTFIEFDAPLIKGLTARIHIGINQSKVTSTVNSLITNLIFFISLLAILSISIAIVIGRRISMPLTDFSQKLLNYSSEDKVFPALTTSDPDINNLVYAFQSVITEREQAENELENEQKRLLLHRNQSPIGIIEWATDFTFVDWNPAAEKIFGFTKEEVLGKHSTECIIHDLSKEKIDLLWEDLIANRGGLYSINENITKEGKIITCEWNNTPLINDDGQVVAVASFVENITEQKNQEELLRRTQKMDALGKLTGGISHDFNNMLGVIMGFAELLQLQIDKDSKLQEYVDEIMHAGERGTILTSKLLAFSKQKGVETQQVNLNSMLLDNKNMLEKTLTARITLVFDLEDDVWPINVDVNDLEDMILNMSINAMHATENSGQLSFKTRNEHLSPHDSDLLGINSGDYVIFTITDTGSGMDKETVEHIFEPFYTTKGSEGTGLGLSQVYGFVSRSRGAIKVYSEKDHGSQFVIYFPRGKDTSSEHANLQSSTKDESFNGTETILVVDDEPALRNLTKQILELKGYSILMAENGKQALELLEREPVDLVLSDIIMPEMDGYQLANKLVERYPKLKIQLISGFTDDRHLENINDELHLNLLYKPINSLTLVKRIRNLLDEE